MSERREQDAKEQGAAAAIERRAWVRFSCDMEASCRSAGAMKNAGWPGRIIDISTGGVGLLLKHRFRPGTLLLVELNNGTETFRRTVPAKVVHATPAVDQADHCWVIGCAFAVPLSDEDVRLLL